MSGLVGRGAWLVASAAGAGRSPLAPGTAGSAVGVALFWPLAALPLAVQLAALGALVTVGTLAATRVAQELGRKDPPVIVVDEVAGQWVALIGIALTPLSLALAFFLFRAMDVMKPWPARDLERLSGGIGIMADDLAAGLFANLLLRAFLAAWGGA
jgi:phosphatidylglycerophosphatase A